MLNQLTTEAVYHFMLIFARFAAAFSLFPGFSNRNVFMRGRLAIALVISFVLLPLVNPSLPKYSDNFSDTVSMIVIEMLIGVTISIGAKFYYWALHVVGQIISMQSGLGAASFFDPTQGSQLAIFTNFLFMIATVAIFVTNTHYLFINAALESYTRFPPGELLNSGDLGMFIARTINNSFILSFKLSSPFLIVSFAILVGSGVLSRLMPNLQVFFVITPAQILVMFGILYIVINVLIAKVIDSITDTLSLVLS